jgi:hypothetical protein
MLCREIITFYYEDRMKHKCSKDKVVPCLTNSALCHEDVWESRCIDPHILDISTRWRWSASLPGRFTLGTHWIGGWVGTRTGLGNVEKRKISPLAGLESDPSAVQPVASRYPGSSHKYTVWTKSEVSNGIICLKMLMQVVHAVISVLCKRLRARNTAFCRSIQPCWITR